MAKHVLAQLGVHTTLALLRDHPAVTAHLPPAFYEHFLLVQQESYKRDRLVHSMLESVDSYLWVRRPPTVPVQFRHARDIEQQYALERAGRLNKRGWGWA